jgi:bacterioferritin
MDKQKAIELLSLDMQDEHAAIMQYLTQAYAIGEGDMACEMEAIAREEMQHFRWLGEKIVALGGRPAMKRGAVIFGGPRVVAMLGEDVNAEGRAIAQYKAHIAELDDPQITLLLNRIIADERAHHEKFLKLQTEPDPAQEVRMEPAVPEGAQQTAGFLQKDATHEYTVILQYLAHAFMTPHCEVEHEMEHAAIEEMRHLGWLAEEMEGLGGRTEMTHDPLALPAATADMLGADLSVENSVAAEYRRQAAASDPETAKLFERLAGEEDYHASTFQSLMTEAATAEPAAPAPSRPKFTVGSLLGKEQK